jgi:hypothetical protein
MRCWVDGVQAHFSSGKVSVRVTWCNKLDGIYALGSNLGPSRMDGCAHRKGSLDALYERALHELLFGEHPSCLSVRHDTYR